MADGDANYSPEIARFFIFYLKFRTQTDSLLSVLSDEEADDISSIVSFMA